MRVAAIHRYPVKGLDAEPLESVALAAGNGLPQDRRFAIFLGARREGPVRLVEAGPLSFSDLPANCVSLINLASVRELEARLGTPVHPLRFRGNVYLDGGAAWEEFAWVGRQVNAGGVTFRVGSRIPRCAATGVNPETAERDLNVVKGLQKTYGHHDMGVYAEVIVPGTLAVGDLVEPRDAAAPSWLGRWGRVARFWLRNVVVFFRGRA